MLRPASVLAALLVVALAAGASADPFSFHFDQVVQDVTDALAAIDPENPDQKRRGKFLKKIDKTFARKSKSVATDAGRAAGVAGLLVKGADDVADLTANFEEGLDSLRDNVDSLVGNVEARRDELPESRLKTKATKKLAKTRAAFDAADDVPGDLVQEARHYKKALLKRRGAVKVVSKAEKKAEQAAAEEE